MSKELEIELEDFCIAYADVCPHRTVRVSEWLMECLNCWEFIDIKSEEEFFNEEVAWKS